MTIQLKDDSLGKVILDHIFWWWRRELVCKVVMNQMTALARAKRIEADRIIHLSGCKIRLIVT